MSLTILENATQAFDILLLSGAGSGAIYLLRWFWWRINAWTEIVAMIVATISACVLVLAVPDEALANQVIDGATMKLLLSTVITTVAWIATTFLTPPEDIETLKMFYRKIHPGGPGWRTIIKQAETQNDPIETSKKWDVPQGILSVLLGCLAIYSALFSIGSFVYGNLLLGAGLALSFGIFLYLLMKAWTKLNIE